MPIYVVRYQRTPLNHNTKRAAVVEAETPQDAQAIVCDMLLRGGEAPESFSGVGLRSEPPRGYDLGVALYAPPPKGRIISEKL